MPYTQEDAIREVGDSEDWPVGLEASVKKWEQRVRGVVNSYSRKDSCGLCFVKRNRKQRCPNCPARPICRNLNEWNDKEVLQALKKLRKELDPTDCGKRCANFKPKNESPFPEGLKTEDLKVGMVVRKGNNDRYTYTILKPPKGVWVKVLLATPGSEPIETDTLLAVYGCQPYWNGAWHSRNWLREVK